MIGEFVMNVTVLSENTKPKKSKLKKEHGLSLLIEYGGNKVLFDTGGPEGTAIHNATALNLELSQIDAVVISHGHNDHTGGLLDFFKLNESAMVYLKKESLDPHYVDNGLYKESIGMDKTIVKDYAERLQFISETTEIFKNFLLIPNIYKKFTTPSTNRLLFSKEQNRFLRDNFNHELFMVVNVNNDLTLFSGCGHTGIINMAMTAKKTFPDAEIKNIIGGFHFQAGRISSSTAKYEEIEATSEWIKKESIDKVFTGHCTGRYGFNIMHSMLGDDLEQLYTGKKIII